MADKTDDERVSIWSTGDTERTWLIFLASVFFYPSLAFVVWQSIENDLYKTIVNAIEAIGPVGLSAITLAFFIIVGVNLMLISVEKYRAKQRQEGRQEGQQEVYNQWLKWFKNVSTEHPDLPQPPFVENETDQNGSATNNK